MNISIFGLGYAGSVAAACLARLGHRVIGCDISENKVDLINRGRATIIEEEIGELVRETHAAGRLSATTDVREAVLQSEVSFLVVGTPGTEDGHLDLTYLLDAVRQIGAALAEKEAFHIVVIRSTVLPGTSEKVGRLLEETSGKKLGEAFTVAVNPEFLREGSAVRDFMDPPYTLIGTDNAFAEASLREIYRGIPGEVIVTELRVAEMMKYVNNSYHALKVSFANEVGNICRALDIDSHKVMEIFCKDTRLNISPSYFRPGFAYGGSCLKKDTCALKMLAQDLSVPCQVISAIDPSNEMQKEHAVCLIRELGRKRIGVLGLSFKPGTDDLRFSPIIDVVNVLIGEGCEVRIYDPNVRHSLTSNTNADLIREKIPHLADAVSDELEPVCRESDVLVIANRAAAFAELPEKYPGKILVDLVRQYDRLDYEGRYEGLSWGCINRNPAQDKTRPGDGEQTAL